jgi:hypothetical protein
MIDRPVIRKAKRTVWLARDYGLDEDAGEVIRELEGMGEEQEVGGGGDLANHLIQFVNVGVQGREEGQEEVQALDGEK